MRTWGTCSWGASPTRPQGRASGGYCPTLEDVLSGPADYIIQYLRRVGRVEPPVDSSPTAAHLNKKVFYAVHGDCTVGVITSRAFKKF